MQCAYILQHILVRARDEMKIQARTKVGERNITIVHSFSDHILFISQGLTLKKQAILHAYVVRAM